MGGLRCFCRFQNLPDFLAPGGELGPKSILEREPLSPQQIFTSSGEVPGRIGGFRVLGKFAPNWFCANFWNAQKTQTQSQNPQKILSAGNLGEWFRKAASVHEMGVPEPWQRPLADVLKNTHPLQNGGIGYDPWLSEVNQAPKWNGLALSLVELSEQLLLLSLLLLLLLSQQLADLAFAGATFAFASDLWAFAPAVFALKVSPLHLQVSSWLWHFVSRLAVDSLAGQSAQRVERLVGSNRRMLPCCTNDVFCAK